ncbi:winged helix-turn-helix transcriptional regulator [Haloarchaeobius amylolyticus]|uniref:winged helix-turn-helix transcriptional regulator n=1 Tax=Haloarchaeobius amylolyticus TaxID=1198296 RepID=UPI002271E12D|nr:metalloregulator ArsR/SmtB family transcription factor [Haloarchaeobius amylolyticus]
MARVDGGEPGYPTATLAHALAVLVVLSGATAALAGPVAAGAVGAAETAGTADTLGTAGTVGTPDASGTDSVAVDRPDNETDLVDGTVNDTTDDTTNTTDETLSGTTDTTSDTTDTVENTTDASGDTVTASGSLSTDLTAGDTTTSTDTDATLDDGLTTNTSGGSSGAVNTSGNASLTADGDTASLSADATVDSVSLSAGVVAPVESLLTVLDSGDATAARQPDSTSRRVDRAAWRGGQFATGTTGDQSRAGDVLAGSPDGRDAAATGAAGWLPATPAGLGGAVPGPMGAGLAAASLAVGGTAYTRGRSILRWLRDALDDSPLGAVLRYSRYDGSDPLAHEDRARIHRVVTDAPGVYLSAISDASDVPLSTVRHHVRILEEEGLVTSVKLEGKRRYFPADTEDRELHAALASPPRAAIIERLAAEGGALVGELAEALDRDPSTLSHHLGRLEDAGLVERERDGRSVVNRLTPTAREGLAAASPAAPVADD